MNKNLTREKIIEMFETDPEGTADLMLSLIQRVEELERRLNQNSGNSSHPPSKDGFNKPKRNTKSQRGKSNKKSGGQPGHKGHRLEIADDPDETVSHSVSSCKKCGYGLEDVAPQSHRKRQVYDLHISVEITEHQAHETCCPQCTHVNQADFPEEVTSPVQYGDGAKAFASYCRFYQLLPSARISEFFYDLTGHRLSEGTLYNTEK